MDKSLTLLFNIFAKNNKELFIVGGAVRDLLLGKIPDDFDLTTDALPDEVASWFPGSYEVGKRFGTIGVVLNGKTYEITTYRKDTHYSDDRHPDGVEYTNDVREDVIRRDFTVNGLLMDSNGCVFDYVGGLRDLEDGILRAIGNPDDRFEEDKLRKWRCIRIAAQKGMVLDNATREAIHMDPSTGNVSVERIRKELDRVILSNKVTWGGYLLVKTELMRDLLNRTIPAFQKRKKDYHLIESFEIMAYLPADLTMRLSILIIPMMPVERLEFLGCLRYPKKTIARVLKISRNFWAKSESKQKFKAAINDVGRDDFNRLLTMQQAFAQWDNNPAWKKMAVQNQKVFSDIIESNDPITLADLAVDGDDVRGAGYEGHDIAVQLKKLLELVYARPQMNNRVDLMAALKEDNCG